MKFNSLITLNFKFTVPPWRKSFWLFGVAFGDGITLWPALISIVLLQTINHKKWKIKRGRVCGGKILTQLLFLTKDVLLSKFFLIIISFSVQNTRFYSFS